MKQITLKKVRDCKELIKNPVRAEKAKYHFSGEIEARDETGKLLFYNKPLFVTDARINNFFFDLKYPSSSRLSGIASHSHIFGYAPRDHIKKLVGRACAFNRIHPRHYAILLGMATHAGYEFERVAPELYRAHVHSLEGISPAWQMDQTIFTSGIINCSNRLIYHTDNGNVKNCYSAMVTMRSQKQRGGFLHLPEYDAIIENENNSLLLFDGGRVLHGVTPFNSKLGKRITIVFYALEGMRKLKPTEAEEIEFWNRKLSGTLDETN